METSNKKLPPEINKVLSNWVFAVSGQSDKTDKGEVNIVEERRNKPSEKPVANEPFVSDF
jgi:hypothetical protein